MQLVDLVQSRLSAAIQKIPMNELDFDPDWEVDPSEIHLMDKLGELRGCRKLDFVVDWHCSPYVISSHQSCKTCMSVPRRKNPMV